MVGSIAHRQTPGFYRLGYGMDPFRNHMDADLGERCRKVRKFRLPEGIVFSALIQPEPLSSFLLIMQEIGAIRQAEKVSAREIHIDSIEQLDDIKDLALTYRLNDR